MRVSVFGLGYVGSVSAASFAADGHDVIGVDVNAGKVESLNSGRSAIVEQGLDELIRRRATPGGCAPPPRPRKRCRRPSCLCSASAPRAAGTAAWTSRTSSASASRSARRCATKPSLPRRRRAQHGAARDDARRGDPGARAALGQEVRRRISASRSIPSSCAKERRCADFRKPPLTLVGHNYAADASGTMALYAGDRCAARHARAFAWPR